MPSWRLPEQYLHNESGYKPFKIRAHGSPGFSFHRPHLSVSLLLNGCAILTKRLSNIELTGKFHLDIFIGKMLNAWKRMLGKTAQQLPADRYAFACSANHR